MLDFKFKTSYSSDIHYFQAAKMTQVQTFFIRSRLNFQQNLKISQRLQIFNFWQIVYFPVSMN